ncbi:acyl-CoA thioesterase [Puniceicoccaceae bacterium K14]|nr:acyl-CoA thioesterase [Puniceicoccaceae bacterium K14]
MIESVSKITVRYAETDAMGIVYHANYMPWLEIGRTQLLKEIGFPYKQLEEDNLLLPVLEINLKYKRPAKYDDEITVITQFKEKPLVKIHLDYQVKRGEELLATGYSVHAFMNRDGQPLKAPRHFIDSIGHILATRQQAQQAAQ